MGSKRRKNSTVNDDSTSPAKKTKKEDQKQQDKAKKEDQKLEKAKKEGQKKQEKVKKEDQKQKDKAEKEDQKQQEKAKKEDQKRENAKKEDQKLEKVKKDDSKTEESAKKPAEENAEKSQQKPKRPPRKRQKGAFKEIVRQMEFYFSDANLAKSKFMKELLELDENAEENDCSKWINLEIFMKFNKLTSMMKKFFDKVEIFDLHKALSKCPSELLEVTPKEEGKELQVRRKKPFKLKENVESCTVYVENIPINSTHDILKRFFYQYGPVDYVSLPKFKNGGLKGFAFIEFVDEKSARKALESFGALEIEDPADLKSIQAFQEEEGEDVLKGRNQEESAGDKEEENGEANNGQETAKNEQQKINESSNSEEDKATVDSDTEVDHSKDPNYPGDSVNQDALRLMSTLQVMPKEKWRKLRNAYLNLQHKQMSKSKKKLREWKQQQQQFQAQQQHYDESRENSKEEIVEKKPALQFEPGLIVKFTLENPLEDKVIWKKKINACSMEPVAYVDATIGHSEIYVRCNNKEQAEKLPNANLKALGASAAQVLEGQDDEDYWEKMRKDREAKLSSKVKTNKPRGKEKIVKQFNEKTELLNTHKYFAD